MNSRLGIYCYLKMNIMYGYVCITDVDVELMLCVY